MTKIGRLTAIAIALIMVLSVASVITVSAAETRTIPTGCIEPGENVVITINTPGTGAVIETICDGWTLVASSLDPGQWNQVGDELQFALLGDPTFTYTLQAPGTPDTCCMIEGVFRDLQDPPVDHPIGGDSEVCTCNGEVVATRTIPAGCVEPGENVVITIDSPGTGAVIETICDGWTYVESSIDLFDQTGNVLTFVLAGDTTFTYTLQAPGTPDTCCTITGIFRDMNQNEFDITGDSEVCTCNGEVVATRTIPDGCVEPGENVVITIDSPGTGAVIETICDGWTYVESSIDLFDQTGNDLTFVLAGDPTFTYTLQVPNEYNRCCTITGIFRDMDQNEFGITGDSEVCTCEEPVVTRTIPDGCIEPGENVVITIDSPGTGAVIETICDGWTYVESSIDLFDQTGNDLTFVLAGDPTFTYTLQAPDTYDTCCTITGIFRDMDQNEFGITGDSEVCTCEEPVPTPIRAIPDECVDAGENVVIEIGFSMPATGVVVETICDGWTYVESSLDPGDVIVLGNDITFTLVEVEVFTYTLQAPDTPDTCCTITGTFMDPLQILWPVVGDENVCTCPDNPPIPDIITPANGATVEGMVTVNVVDLSGEGDVLYCLIEYLDGTTGEIVNDTTAPYSGDWDTTAVPNGDYTIRATMEDGIGQIGTDEITVTVDNPVCPNSDWYLELEAGWNLVSVPKMLEGAPVNATTLFNLVMGEDANYYDAATGTWVSNNDITDVKPCQGYWVLKSAPETICIDFETGWTEPPVQELYVGWNIIGHVSTDAWSAEEFLGITGLEGKCTMLKTLGAQGEIGWAYYYPTAPGLSTFVDMTPGYGYWIAVTEDTVMFGTA